MENEDKKPEVVKVKSLKRAGIICFAAGFIASILIVAFIIFVLLGGRLIGKDEAEYYSGLDKKYGKVYRIEEMIDEQALYKNKNEDMTDALAATIVSGLKDDKYALYFTKEEFDVFRKEYVDTYTGIGVAIRSDESGVVVVDRVIEGGPADKAGIKDGDIFTHVDGKAVDSASAASDALTGKAGSKVTVTVDRNGKTTDFKMNRAVVEDRSVSYKVYDADNKIGYVQIRTFRDGTGREVRNAVKDLKNNGCDKLIFDLRDNVGGITDEGLDVADYLLPSCRIMTEKRRGSKDKVYNSDESSCGVKYVLLVNENTASASEILTAAVKENNGGTIIGTRTYGKGLIQKLHSFSDGTAVKFTIGEYFSPKGNKINEIGIEPDIGGPDVMAIAVRELCK